jgi:hypothetical protein
LFINIVTKKIKALPLNIAWGIWLTKSLKLFEGHETLPLKCATQYLNILNEYPRVEEKQKQKTGHKNMSSIRTFLGHTLMVLIKGIPQKEIRE